MDHKRRLALLKKKVKAAGLDSFLVTDEINVSYLSGFAGSDSMMLVTPGRTFFITDSRYIQEAEESLRGVALELAAGSAYSKIRDLVKAERLKRMGFESMDLSHAVALKLKEMLPGVRLAPLKDTVEGLRAVKDAEEVRAIKRSIRLTKSVLYGTLRRLRPGVTEESLARAIEISFIEQGARPAFDPIVAAGANSSKPHASSGPSRIRKDSFVMIDIGCRLGGYCSDMTRTVITGAMKERFAKIYTVVRAAQQRAIDKVRDGARMSEVDFAARGYIHSMGFGRHFGHSVGHGVGMEIHEQPAVSRTSGGFLKKGMVMTVEPAIYLPGFGGVRIEDMVLVTDKGCEILTEEQCTLKR